MPKKPSHNDVFAMDDAWFSQASYTAKPPPKQVVSIRLDSDLVAWFKAQGPGYQARMRDVLVAHHAARSGK